MFDVTEVLGLVVTSGKGLSELLPVASGIDSVVTQHHDSIVLLSSDQPARPLLQRDDRLWDRILEEGRPSLNLRHVLQVS